MLRKRPPYVLIIENFASFVRHVREIAFDDGALVIFSGGFPSRAALAAITRLAVEAGTPCLHWGDMDAGGVRIFRHLETALLHKGVVLRPHLMDPLLLQEIGTLMPDGQKPVTGDLNGSAVAALGELIRSKRLVHEQEELVPRRPDLGG